MDDDERSAPWWETGESPQPIGPAGGVRRRWWLLAAAVLAAFLLYFVLMGLVATVSS